jgi:ElaB/YqjD/DUF883 family membrane-anchored ribosome-binding protein
MGSGTSAVSAHHRPNPQEIDEMSTASKVEHWPNDMVQASHAGLGENWAESTIRSVVDSVEDYAHREPLMFAACALGIGFVLGWKLKPW